MDFDPETTLSRAGQSCRGDSAPAHPPASHRLDASAPESDASSHSSPQDTLEETLAELDGGAGATACATGLSAVSAVTHLLDADAHLIRTRECSSDTAHFLSCLDEQSKLSVSSHSVSDPEALTDAVRPSTAALWVETPSSAQLRVADLEALSDFADAHDLLLVVDNTVLSPVVQRPIEHGADLVVYSSIQGLNGHSDVTGGAVVARTARLANELARVAETYGLNASASDSQLILRGVKTLSVRMEQSEKNTRSIVHVLDEHPAVERVLYPGLRTHPGHDTARRQQDAYGSVVSFVVDETEVDVDRLLRAPDVFSHDDSLGGVGSKIGRPASTHRDPVGAEHEDASSPPCSLLRLSIGIESTDDLIHDLEQALEGACSSRRSSVRTASKPTPGPRVRA